MFGTPCSDNSNNEGVCTYSLTLRKRPQVKEECCTASNCSGIPEDSKPILKSHTVSQSPPCAEELRKREQCLNQKEKELLKLQKRLQKQRNQLKKKFDAKAKAELKAAKKLNVARKNLQLTVSATRTCGGCNQKKQTEKKETLPSTKCMCDKIHSKLDKLHKNLTCFCEKTRGFSDSCAVYVKKVKGATHHSEEVASRCVRACNLDPCLENMPNRSCACSRLQSAAGDCYEMAMRPVFWSWPPPRPACCRPQLIKPGNFLALLASFIIWLPCLFCVALICCCYSCLCYDC